MHRPSWSGVIRLSLVSIPVKGFTALEAEKARISLNQLHEECHSRIRYQKTCPIHGEVSKDEIVMGYQYGQGQYAIIDPSEIDQLRSDAERAITIDKFLSLDSIDPIYFAGQTYYLLPDKRNGEKPYAVLQRAMAQEKVVGLAQAVISNREQLVLLRPVDRLLTMSVLHYYAAIRHPDTFNEELEETAVSPQEVKLAKSLIDMTLAKEPRLEDYDNVYNDRMAALVEAKVEGKEIVTPPAEVSGPPTINIMDALKASLEAKRPRSPGSKKLTARAKPAAKRRKSG
jgi:DNA end-binding protein Ku